MKKLLMILIVGLATTLFATGSIAAESMEVDIHGFISQGYLSSTENDFSGDSEDNSFAFSEVGINFGKELSENLRFGIQMFARDFGDTSDNAIRIDWAFADYRFSELMGVRFGQIKLPHGLYNEVRDIDMLRNPIFLPDSVYGEVSHDLYVNDVFLSLQGISSRDLFLSLQGIGLYGYIDLSIAGGLTYQAMYGTQNIDPNSEIGNRQLKYFTNMIPDIPISNETLSNDSIDVDFKYAGNLIWDTPLDGLRLGTSLNNIQMNVTTRFTHDVPYDLGDGNIIQIASQGDIASIDYKKLQNLVFSTEYTWDNLILMAEFILIDKDYEITFIDQVEDYDNTSTGWYIGGAYRLIDWFEIGAYYSQSRYEEVESADDFPVYFFTEFDDICGTLRFDINEYWTVKLETHMFRGVYPVVDSFLDDTLEDYEENWYMFAAKMTVAF